MIKPALQGEAFLVDVRDAASLQDDLHIWWLGQSGFLVQWRGSHLLFDPYLSDSLSRKYAATDKPHARMTEQVIAPDALDFIDLTTSSHNHTDHLDGETLTALMQANPEMQLLVPAANRAFAAERLGVDPDQLEAIDAGQSIVLGPFEIHAVPAAHEDLSKDDRGRHQFVGYVWPSLGRGLFITAATPSRTTAWRRFYSSLGKSTWKIKDYEKSPRKQWLKVSFYLASSRQHHSPSMERHRDQAARLAQELQLPLSSD